MPQFIVNDRQAVKVTLVHSPSTGIVNIYYDDCNVAHLDPTDGGIILLYLEKWEVEHLKEKGVAISDDRITCF